MLFAGQITGVALTCDDENNEGDDGSPTPNLVGVETMITCI
jgi:hypothetical protein